MDPSEFLFTPYEIGNESNSYGYIQCSCPDDLKPKVLEAIKSKDTPYQHQLVGQIEEEYLVEGLDGEWEDFIKCASLAHESSFPGYWNYLKGIHHGEVGLHLSLPWVNYMKKNEYNPLHCHDGILSYVMWVKVPFFIEDEVQMYPSSKDSKAASTFTFVFGGTQGINQINIPVDNTWEWEMVVFPSDLYHMVYPFQTSDDTRISISGNIHLD